MAIESLRANGFFLQPMRVEHIAAIAEIERLSFTQPWPAHAYRKEIKENRMAFYAVARVVEEGVRGQGSGVRVQEAAVDDRHPTPGTRYPAPVREPGLIERLTRLIKPVETVPPELDAELRSIVGYAGLWLLHDEAHVTTIAVHPDYRGQGLGELLLLGLFDHAFQIGAKWMTLEVRVSNDVAQALYRKYTFKEMGVRKAYYSDNREDALVMWTDPLDSPAFREILERNRARLFERLDSRG